MVSAGSLLRDRGISGTSIAEVMEGAGMTVGGFYAHFPNKSTLVAEVLRDALEDSLGLMRKGAGEKRGAEWVKAAARLYLSRHHRDHPEEGCPLPAVLGELPRGGRAPREALAEGLADIAGEMASHLEEAGAQDPGEEALALLAVMAGGLSLARALKDTSLSDRVLRACRAHVERCVSGPGPRPAGKR
jgi:TetR/AcrR family transcriptional repressor of nem operon